MIRVNARTRRNLTARLICATQFVNPRGGGLRQVLTVSTCRKRYSRCRKTASVAGVQQVRNFRTCRRCSRWLIQPPVATSQFFGDLQRWETRKLFPTLQRCRQTLELFKSFHRAGFVRIAQARTARLRWCQTIATMSARPRRRVATRRCACPRTFPAAIPVVRRSRRVRVRF